MRKVRLIAIPSLLIANWFSTHVFAQAATTSTWIGPTGGAWSNPDNWSPAGVPTQDVTISTTTPLSINMDYSGAKIGPVTVSGPITFSGSGTLPTAEFNMTGVTINGGAYSNQYGPGKPSTFSNGTISTGIIEATTQSTIEFSNINLEAGGSIQGGIDTYFGFEGTNNLNGGSIDYVDDGRFYIESNATVNINAPTDIGSFFATDNGTLNVMSNLEGYTSYYVIAAGNSPAVMNILSGSTLSIQPTYDGGCDFDVGTGGSVNQYGGSVYGGGYQSPPGPNDYVALGIGIGGTDGSALYHLIGGTLNAGYLGVGATTTGPVSAAGPGTFQQDGGRVFIGSATILAGSNVYLNAGSFSGTISNAGLLKIDSSVTLSIPQLTESTGSELQLTDLSTMAAMIQTSEASSLAGELSITLAAGYSPAIGDVLDIISSPALTGEFDNYDLPSLGGDLYWQPEYSPTDFSLVVLPEPGIGVLAMMIFAGTVVRRRK